MTMDSNQQAFLEILKGNPEDWTARAIYADWLDENDQPEEADRQRRYKTSWEWMREFVKKHHTYAKYHDWEPEERKEPDETKRIIDEYYEQFIAFLIGHVEEEGSFWFAL